MLQKDYTCGVITLSSVFPFCFLVLFSHTDLESNYPHLVYSITFVLLLPKCHTNQTYCRYHENRTVIFLPLFPLINGVKHLVYGLIQKAVAKLAC